MRSAALVAGAASIAVFGLPSASAQELELDADYVVDGSITGGAFLASYLIKQISVATDEPWTLEFFGALDKRVRGNFSLTAASVSDLTLIAGIVAPLALNLSSGFDEAVAKRALIFGESIALTTLPTALVKVLVGRPRPYTYAIHPEAVKLKKERGDRTHRSFYSGHTSVAFAAAVASSTLFAYQHDNENARLAVWGSQIALATFTGNLRVIAGRHYYSDVAVGAIIGSAVAFATVSLHAEDEVYTPSAPELAVMGAGVIVGVLVSELIPFRNIGFDAVPTETITVAPMSNDDGVVGISVLGAF